MNSYRQFLMYLIVGGLSFLIDFGVLVFLRELIITDATPLLATICSTISFSVSFIFNYYLSLKIVFIDHKSNNKTQDFLITLIIACVGLGLTVILMYISEFLLGINYMVGKVIVTGIVLIWNFVARKKIVFR